ncbi:MAG TPA: hypothetical protein VH637_25160 [Streptosporangiaceae bacterium]|jgi:hypothetical protein
MPDRYTSVVKGPAAIFPRGYLLLIPVWYLAAAIAIKLKGGLPGWYTLIALGALLLVTLILLGVLANLHQNAFAADHQGIWLGTLPRRKRSRRRRLLVPWSQVELVQITDRYYGARLDVLLGPAASIIHRHRVASGVFFCLALVVPPPWIGRPAGLLSARAHRYRIPICDTTADQLGLALVELAPPSVRFGVVLKRRWLGLRRPARPA